MKRISAVLLFGVLLMCVSMVLSASVGSSSLRAVSADEIPEVVLDDSILSVRRTDSNEDEMVLSSLQEIDSELEEESADSDLLAHTSEIEKIEDVLAADEEAERSFTSLLEVGKSEYPADLMKRVNDALKANEETWKSDEVKTPMKKPSASEIALKKIRVDLAMAPNMRRGVIDHADHLKEMMDDYVAKGGIRKLHPDIFKNDKPCPKCRKRNRSRRNRSRRNRSRRNRSRRNRSRRNRSRRNRSRRNRSRRNRGGSRRGGGGGGGKGHTHTHTHSHSHSSTNKVTNNVSNTQTTNNVENSSAKFVSRSTQKTIIKDRQVVRFQPCVAAATCVRQDTTVNINNPTDGTTTTQQSQQQQAAALFF
jgi:hypothetical protein